jgi:replicative DNA helicase
MNRETMTKMVLRSLCANTPDEEIKALENYRYTNIEGVNLSAVAGSTLELIRQFYERSTLAGPPSISALMRFAEADLNTDLILYIKEVGVEIQTFGASYRSLFGWFIGDMVGDELSELLQATNQVLKEGVKIKVGANTELKQGVRDAIDHVVIGATKLKQHLNPSQQPMDLHLGAKELTEDYVRKSRNPALSYGLTTNIVSIDDATGGAQNKELWVIAGATGHGKTTLVINWARHLILLGFNILFYSLEMSKDKVLRILYCSHSCNAKFNRKPLLYNQIKFGTLSTEDANFYLNTVIPDLKSASGSIQVFNPLGRTTIEDIQQQAEVFNREFPLDIIFIDYINILSAPKGVRLASRNERIAENISRAKQLALEFDNGFGVTVVTPCQVNRAGEKKASDANGIYDRDAIADTSELEKTADALFTIYQDKPLRQKREAIICNLKMRDSGLIDSFPIYLPAEHRFVGASASANDSQLSELLVV